MLKLVRSYPSHDLNLLSGQFEGSSLKLKAFARSIRQKKSVIYVQKVSIDVNHDVVIVSISNLENVANKTVGSQGLHVIVSRLSERLCVSSMNPSEVLNKWHILAQSLFDAINALRVLAKL